MIGWICLKFNPPLVWRVTLGGPRCVGRMLSVAGIVPTAPNWMSRRMWTGMSTKAQVRRQRMAAVDPERRSGLAKVLELDHATVGL